ncbi:MAG: DUF3179 domain-containing (seleno)protein [Halopseudomonas sp.]
MKPSQNAPKLLFILLAIVTALFSIASAVLMTEPGQSLNLPREWIVTYYDNHWLLIACNLALLGWLWVLNEKHHFWHRILLSLASVGVVICIVSANFLLAAFFPPAQYDANYVTVAEADKILSDQEVVYAVEINGDVKGYPRTHLEIPHIAGANIGGEEVVMTFCALSNLPVVYNQDIGHGKSELGILIQAHNNLVMVDRQSGELIQQITGEAEFSDQTALQSYPNDMMSWASFKTLYPDGEVFIYKFDRVVDDLLMTLFEAPMKKQFSEEYGPIFPTLDLADTRLTNKEQIWGVNLGDAQVAFTERFLKSNPVYAFDLAGKQLLVNYDPTHRIVSLYDQPDEATMAEIAQTGQLPTQDLTKLPMHNGVFWMVWSHWFPSTELYN